MKAEHPPSGHYVVTTGCCTNPRDKRVVLEVGGHEHEGKDERRVNHQTGSSSV
jgi:very-short-patch-repair endonuclease